MRKQLLLKLNVVMRTHDIMSGPNKDAQGDKTVKLGLINIATLLYMFPFNYGVYPLKRMATIFELNPNLTSPFPH
jgi:hypothetical protein